MSNARMEKREAVYFEAVRERQELKEELRDASLSVWRRDAALARAGIEVMKQLHPRE